jgi:hypothetical protein
LLLAVAWPTLPVGATGQPPAAGARPDGSGADWSPEELNWYGISQRRINDTRADAGLALFAADRYLWGLAHERARDMLQRGYLGPTTPEGLDAGAYMRKDGARYDRWVEFRADDASADSQADVSWRIIAAFLNDAAAREVIVGDFDRFGVALAEAKERRVFVVLIAKASPPPTPTPAPEPAVAAAPPTSIPEIIRAAAVRHGTDPERLLRVARCESGLNPRAYNPAGPYIGLFQFHPNTFRAFGGKDIYDPYDQSDVAARMFARGLAHHWGCK